MEPQSEDCGRVEPSIPKKLSGDINNFYWFTFNPDIYGISSDSCVNEQIKFFSVYVSF